MTAYFAIVLIVCTAKIRILTQIETYVELSIPRRSGQNLRKRRHRSRQHHKIARHGERLTNPFASDTMRSVRCPAPAPQQWLHPLAQPVAFLEGPSEGPCAPSFQSATGQRVTAPVTPHPQQLRVGRVQHANAGRPRVRLP